MNLCFRAPNIALKIGTIIWIAVGFSVAAEAKCRATAPAEIAETIARGHAFRKHVEGVDNPSGGREFEAGRVIARLAFPSPSIDDPAQFAALLNRAMASDDSAEIARGRRKYWDRRTGTIVIFDPASRDCGTAFRPNGGRSYYDRLK